MLLTLGALPAAGFAQTDNPLGFYIGAAYGQADIRANLGGLTPSGAAPLGEFSGTHSAYQGMLGIRPVSFLGAEITYMDFGQISSGPGAGGSYPTAVQVSQKGEAAFALLYLPVPVIDVYVKAGLSRITTDMSATYALPGVGTCEIDHPNCALYVVRRTPTDVSFAYGAGLQWKLGQWAVRGEYQRFSAAGANPSLFSIGMTYWLQ
ncbi:MAG: outer membrane beta-barrel protein [Steroidobacteraceae bacterium]